MGINMDAPKKPKLKTFQIMLLIGARQLPITWTAKAETKEKATEATIAKFKLEFGKRYNEDIPIYPLIVEEL